MATFVLSTAISSGLVGFFGYLKYRSYLRCVQHIADRHGLQGLRELDRVARPSTIVIPMTRKSSDVSGDLPQLTLADAEAQRL